MQNTFSQSGNDSKWFFKKSFFRIGMWHSRPPRDPSPLHGKYHLKFPFWLSAPLPYCASGRFCAYVCAFLSQKNMEGGGFVFVNINQISWESIVKKLKIISTVHPSIIETSYMFWCTSKYFFLSYKRSTLFCTSIVMSFVICRLWLKASWTMI